MSIRVPTARRAGLALLLCLAVVSPTTAKPPDLPQPSTADFATEPVFLPLIEPVPPPAGADFEECEARPAQDRGRRSCLFAFHPVFAFVWPEWTCDHQPTAGVTWHTMPVVREVVLQLFYGPFGSRVWSQPGDEEAAETLPMAPTTVEMLPVAPKEIEGCPACPALQGVEKSKCGEAKVRVKAVEKKAAKAELMTRIRECMAAARMYREFGFKKEEADCYEEIRKIAPGTIWERKAGAMLEALCAGMRPGTEETAESKDTPDEEQSTAPREPVQVYTAYDVSDLLGEKVGNNVLRTAEVKLARELKQYLESAIEPGSWQAQGGKGEIEYYLETNSLVIRHDQAVQEQVAGLLESLRRMKGNGGQPSAWLRKKNLRGDEEPAAERTNNRPAPKMALMGLDIGELLTSHDVEWDRTTDTLRVVAKYDPEGLSAELIRLIENGVASDSWHGRGGPGRIDYNSELRTLFVTNTSAILEDVAALIQSRRREMQLHKERCENEVRMSQVKRQVRRGIENRIERDRVIRNRQAFAATEQSLVDAILQECREALLKGKKKEAELLACCALSMDRKAVMEHPLVYKMQLLSQVFAEPGEVKMEARMPGVDPGVVRAYTEILQMAPRMVPVLPASFKKPAVLEVAGEQSELEIVTEDKADSSCCIDVDAKGKRMRFQYQIGPWTLKLTDEGQGKSFSMTLNLCGAPK